MSIADITKMTVVKRIHLIEQSWDTLNQRTIEVYSPVCHKELLKERKKL